MKLSDQQTRRLIRHVEAQAEATLDALEMVIGYELATPVWSELRAHLTEEAVRVIRDADLEKRGNK